MIRVFWHRHELIVSAAATKIPYWELELWAIALDKIEVLSLKVHPSIKRVLRNDLAQCI